MSENKKTPTIYEIKRRTEQSSPYYFDRKTMRFFGQTLRDYRVTKRDDGRFDINAPMKNGGKTVGTSHRIFNPENNKLESN